MLSDNEKSQEQYADYDVEDITMDDDGIVRLNLANEETQKKVWKQIQRLKNFQTG